MVRTTPAILLLLCSLYGYSQQKPSSLSDSESDNFRIIEASGAEYFDSLYTVATGMTHAYINGSEYYPYHYRSKHKPLLFYGKERTASITVNSRKFDNLVLQYDTYTDQVIFSEIENAYGKRLHQIAINHDIIDSFTLCFRTDTLTFRYLGEQEAGKGLPPGFFEVAYDGNTVYLIRHRSLMHQRNGIDEYFWSPVGYIKSVDGYNKIGSNGKFIKLFGEGAPQMKRILVQRKIKVRKAGKREIIEVLKHYDSL